MFIGNIKDSRWSSRPSAYTSGQRRRPSANSCGAVMAEFAIALVLLAAIAALSKDYIRAYLLFDEQSLVQQSLAVGRLSVIPALTVSSPEGDICGIPTAPFNDLTAMYLTSAFSVSTSGSGRCQDNGDFRLAILKIDCDPNNPGACIILSQTYLHDECDYRGAQFTFDCGGRRLAEAIPAVILQQISDYATSGSFVSTIDIAVVYSNDHPEYGAIISNLRV